MAGANVRICDWCGAPLGVGADAACRFCKTRVLADADVPPPTSFSILLLNVGRGKVQVMNQIFKLTKRDFGPIPLLAAKDLVDRAKPGIPVVLAERLDAGQARDWAEHFFRVGAMVEIRPTIEHPDGDWKPVVAG